MRSWENDFNSKVNLALICFDDTFWIKFTDDELCDQGDGRLDFAKAANNLIG